METKVEGMAARGLRQAPARWRGTEEHRIQVNGKEEPDVLSLPLQVQRKGECAHLLLLRCCGQSR